MSGMAKEEGTYLPPSLPIVAASCDMECEEVKEVSITFDLKGPKQCIWSLLSGSSVGKVAGKVVGRASRVTGETEEAKAKEGEVC